jgi:type IV secretion system protein VirB5
MDAYDTATSRLNQIEQLSKQINATDDPKAIAELQGRIATEQAAINNEQTKLQLYQMVADAQDKIQEQRQRELNVQAAARRGYVQPEPVRVAIGGGE